MSGLCVGDELCSLGVRDSIFPSFDMERTFGGEL